MKSQRWCWTCERPQPDLILSGGPELINQLAEGSAFNRIWRVHLSNLRLALEQFTVTNKAGDAKDSTASTGQAAKDKTASAGQAAKDKAGETADNAGSMMQQVIELLNVPRCFNFDL
ncbi:hypothetical protein R1sor_015125 [Riccia sorocarpa]|uniref:Uncharacterized protein n=1 Tax=Riccia sorocarpa TaxID=122646 RepID=A0ABD3HD83_9MARC